MRTSNNENIAIYVRVSTDEQADRGTIENQIEFATKYCDLHNLPISFCYRDDGITGTIPLESRPEGYKLLQDAKEKKFDTLLVYKLDRLGRAARVVLNAVHELEQHGVKVKSMTEPFDTGDASGRFLLTILAGVADLERSNILDRMWHGANRAARAGKWLGGIVPYGYTVVDGCLAISNDPIPDMNMSEADVVSLIYQLTVEQHLSTIKIADYLNALGIPPKYTLQNRQISRGKRKENTAGVWRPSRIRNMIIETTYMGLHRYGKRTQKQREIIDRKVPAIVTIDTWELAQKVLKENQLEATRSAKRHYLLRSLVKCNCCGLNYSGTSYNGPKHEPKAYYVCNGKTTYRGPLQGKCTSKNIPAEWLEDYVWQDCLEFILTPGKALSEINDNNAEIQERDLSIQNEITLIIKSIQDKETEKQNILDLYRRQFITAKDVELQLEKINNERLTLDQRLEALKEDHLSTKKIADHMHSAGQLLVSLKEKLKDGEPTYEVKREIIKSLVKEVLIKTKKPEDDLHQLQATVAITYSFSKDALHTDKDSLRRSA